MTRQTWLANLLLQGSLFATDVVLSLAESDHHSGSPTADEATTGPPDGEGLKHTNEEVLIQNESLFIEVKEMDINHERDCKDSAWALPKKDKKVRESLLVY